MGTKSYDWPTVAAVGLAAMCVVTFDHEALGHGGACLALGGRIVALSSSVFRCSQPSGLIDAAGPLANLLGGTVALAVRLVVPRRRIVLRLFLALVTGFSFFWESAYLVQAAVTQHGDLYFFARWAFGSIPPWQRWTGAAIGVVLYILAVRLMARTLLDLAPDAKEARSRSRVAWLSATTGAALAALAYTGSVHGDLRDAVLEIGAASIPLLFIPSGSRQGVDGQITRNGPVIAVALAVYGVFVLVLGRGLG